MATFYSDQQTRNTQVVPAKMNSKNEGGLLSRIWFSYTAPAASPPTVGDYVELCKIPDNARVMGGVIATEAHGGTAAIDIGYSGADTRYLSAGSVVSAGQVSFGNSIALNHGDVLSGETTLRAKVSGSALAVTKKLWGYVDVLLP